jgi:biopolymer transport protein ExbD
MQKNNFIVEEKMVRKPFRFEIRIQIAVTLLIGFTFATVLAQHPLQAFATPASQTQKTTAAAPATIKLNLDDIGTSADTSILSQKLVQVFKLRKDQHAYKIGFERRSDLPEADRIEKRVFVKADRSITLEQISKLIKVLENAGADPVALPIYSNGKTDKNCLTCALKDVTGFMKPSPLVLLVRITAPNTRPSLDGEGQPSISDFLISDSIPIVLSIVGGGESLAVISIPKDGEFNFGEKRIEKAALENEIRHRIKAKPGTEKALAIKCSPDITYGSLEDIYPAAFAAGAKRIILDATLSATREQ